MRKDNTSARRLAVTVLVAAAAVAGLGPANDWLLGTFWLLGAVAVVLLDRLGARSPRPAHASAAADRLASAWQLADTTRTDVCAIPTRACAHSARELPAA